MLKLRDYQSVAIHSVFEAWRQGARSVVLVAPTGCGKRIIALWLMDYAAKAGRRVLFVGNRRLLVTQAQNDAERLGLDYGVIMSDAESGNPGSTNQLASIQTLESWYFTEKWSNELTGRGLPTADLVVVDEVHTEENRYRQLLQLYPDSKFLGLTATPVGTDGRAIVPRPYDVLVEPIKNSELISQGFLLPTKVYAPSEPNIEGVKVVNRGEYNQAQLGRRVSECTVFADVYSEWQKHGEGRATVCFVPGIPFGRDLVRQFNFLLGAGSAHLIEAKTKHAEREEIFSQIASGKARIVVSVDVLREGFDLPLLSCGVDLQPNTQLRSYWQKIGRIKRPCEAQADAIWLDFAGNYWKFPHPNQDPTWPQGEEDTQEAIKAARKAGDQTQPIMCPKCLFVRERGAVCPQCGHTAGEAIRRIRMGNGKLQEIPAIQKVQREKTEAEKLFAKWQGRLFGAMHSGLSFAQCSALFLKETGQQPRPHWPGAFQRDSVNWRKCPKTYFNSTRELAIALRRATP